MRIHVYTSPDGKSESGLSLTEVKKRIRKQGGSGCTQHYDRDGSFQESTPIVLGNNARTTYQAEYNTSKKYRTMERTTGTADALDIEDVLRKVVEQAKAEKIQEEDNERLMHILTPHLGEKAVNITEQWYDWALCQIHGRLWHEYRGMGRSLRRSKEIRKWKEEHRKGGDK